MDLTEGTATISEDTQDPSANPHDFTKAKLLEKVIKLVPPLDINCDKFFLNHYLCFVTISGVHWAGSPSNEGPFHQMSVMCYKIQYMYMNMSLYKKAGVYMYTV